MSEPKKPRQASLRSDGDLYEQALAACSATGRFTVSQIRREIACGLDRARKILAMMQEAGVVPDGAGAPAPKEKKLRGRAGAALKEAPKTQAECAERLQDVADMTIRQVVAIYGTETRFLAWLDAHKKLADIETHTLKNEMIRGNLVNKGLVKTGVLDNVEASHLKMLTDGARTISTMAETVIKAGGSVDEIQKMVEDQLSSFIRPMKAKIKRSLLARNN